MAWISRARRATMKSALYNRILFHYPIDWIGWIDNQKQNFVFRIAGNLYNTSLEIYWCTKNTASESYFFHRNNYGKLKLLWVLIMTATCLNFENDSSVSVIDIFFFFFLVLWCEVFLPTAEILTLRRKIRLRYNEVRISNTLLRWSIKFKVMALKSKDRTWRLFSRNRLEGFFSTFLFGFLKVFADFVWVSSSFFVNFLLFFYYIGFYEIFLW
jgi:hypothetical protein